MCNLTRFFNARSTANSEIQDLELTSRNWRNDSDEQHINFRRAALSLQGVQVRQVRCAELAIVPALRDVVVGDIYHPVTTDVML